MNIHAFPRTVVNMSLWLARMPLDAAVRLLPGTSSSSAKLAVDRADVAARSFAGAVTLDPGLREDARRRRAAASEREKAAKLRGRAQQTTEEARARSEQRSDQAQRRRAEADRRATRRREQAEQQAERTRSRAASTEQQRKNASRNGGERVEEQIESAAPAKRLEALEQRSEAQREREEALTVSDEASRLAEAAAAVKDERKQD